MGNAVGASISALLAGAVSAALTARGSERFQAQLLDGFRRRVALEDLEYLLEFYLSCSTGARFSHPERPPCAESPDDDAIPRVWASRPPAEPSRRGQERSNAGYPLCRFPTPF